MSITLHHIDGVGINARYGVRQNGMAVAMIDRNGNTGWRIDSVYYNERLGFAKNINEAKHKAARLNYPSEQEVYESICERTAKNRKHWTEHKYASVLAQLARDILTGSNHAHEELKRVVAKIDAYIADRSDTRAARLAKNEQHFQATGERRYIYESDGPLYPNPPEGVEHGPGSNTNPIA
jgi:chorismate mutase